MKLFKSYNQNQLFLLPPDISSMIPEGHLVRVVNRIINGLDLSRLISKYSGGGAPAYHPLMMLKILVYAYLDGIYTSRKIAKALRENIYYMWLSGMQAPDFRTISNFRSGRLKEEIKEIFKQVVGVAESLGLVRLDTLYIDGTKVGANANRHKMVWRKSVERYKKGVEKKIEEFLEEIDRLNDEEDEIYGENDLSELGEGVMDEVEVEKKVDETVRKINQKISRSRKRGVGDRVLCKRRKERLRKEIKRLELRRDRYREMERVLGKRNSYSKTDPSATAMMMKDGVIIPGYNLMIGVENQVIINYRVEQEASDGACFITLMEDIKSLYGRLPRKVVGDAAFGNEENYVYCEEGKMDAYLKYSTFHLEKTPKYRKNIFRRENFRYDKGRDRYICPANKILEFESEKVRITFRGYRQVRREYVCRECGSCEYKNLCCRGRNRTIVRNERFERLKGRAKELIESEEGRMVFRRRGVEVEMPFANMKENHKFRRFLLRGLKKVEIEAGLYAIVHNIKRIARGITEVGRNKTQLVPT